MLRDGTSFCNELFILKLQRDYCGFPYPAPSLFLDSYIFQDVPSYSKSSQVLEVAFFKKSVAGLLQDLGAEPYRLAHSTGCYEFIAEPYTGRYLFELPKSRSAGFIVRNPEMNTAMQS